MIAGPPQGPAPASGGVRLVRIERASDEAWAGVAQRDNGGQRAGDIAARVATLAAGDAAALLVFAVVGRLTHGEGLSPGDVFSTALPFLLAWFASAPATGAFSPPARGDDMKAATAAAAKSWALAVPLALVLRAISQGGRAPPVPFAIVSFVVGGGLLLGGRAIAASRAPKVDRMAAATSNRKGNPLEFLSLLNGLVRRW